MIILALFFVGIYTQRWLPKNETMSIFNIFALIFLLFSIVEYWFFYSRIKSGNYKIYKLLKTGNNKGSAVVMILMFVLFTVAIVYFTIKGENKIITSTLYIIYPFVLLQLWLRYKYETNLYVNDKEIINFPIGISYRWSRRISILANPKLGTLSIYPNNFLGHFLNRSGDMHMSQEEFERFLSEQSINMAKTTQLTPA